jgi:cellobiose phosphorylase
MAGWTWYTGSASWFQKIIVDWILGIRADQKGLIIDPCIPKEWKSFSVKRKFRGTEFEISVLNNESVSSGVSYIEINGIRQQDNLIKIPADKKVKADVFLGKPLPAKREQLVADTIKTTNK